MTRKKFAGKRAGRAKPAPSTVQPQQQPQQPHQTEQADSGQLRAVADIRARVWELHLRGYPKAAIAREVNLKRDTVADYIRQQYEEFGEERRAEAREKLEAAIARMRRIQQQAWVYADEDDERERAVLEAAKPGMRYQSQRSQYLRVVLDAEKEIARLEGLYDALVDESGGVVFRIAMTPQGGLSVTSGATAGMSAAGVESSDGSAE